MADAVATPNADGTIGTPYNTSTPTLSSAVVTIAPPSPVGDVSMIGTQPFDAALAVTVADGAKAS